MERITATLQALQQITGILSGTGSLSVGLCVPEKIGGIPFEGSYEYTPTDATQVIAINGKRATSDIVINPIPSNYGLITWNGSYLTVS